MKYHCVSELSPEHLRASGVIELGEYDFGGMHDAIRRIQDNKGWDEDAGELLTRMIHMRHPYIPDLVEYISWGADLLQGSQAFVAAREPFDRSPEGNEYGLLWHKDIKSYSMVVSEGPGTMLIIDPEKPGAMLEKSPAGIGSDYDYVFTTRPGIVTLLHKRIWHQRQHEVPDDRRLFRVRFASGTWPAASEEQAT